MACFIRSILCLILMFFVFTSAHPTCGPVEEGKSVVLSCKVNFSKSCPDESFTWNLKGGMNAIAARCNKTSCYIALSTVKNITLSGSGPVVFSKMTIGNVRRTGVVNSTEVWNCVTKPECGGKSVLACPRIEIYALAEKPTCRIEEVLGPDGSLQSIKVITNTSKIFPNANCLFYHDYDSVQQGKPKDVTGRKTGETKHGTEIFYYYYSYECETTYLTKCLDPGIHKFYSQIYPEVAGGTHLPGLQKTLCGVIDTMPDVPDAPDEDGSTINTVVIVVVAAVATILAFVLIVAAILYKEKCEKGASQEKPLELQVPKVYVDLVEDSQTPSAEIGSPRRQDSLEDISSTDLDKAEQKARSHTSNTSKSKISA